MLSGCEFSDLILCDSGLVIDEGLLRTVGILNLWVCQILLVLHFDARTAYQNKEQTASCESARHGIAHPTFIVANKEHAGAEKVKDSFSKDSLHEFEVSHDEVEVAKWDEHD